ncbi:MAG: hypothetical protein FWD15_06360 [Alphaproteobacteria bacterium]|nr:hypothetical protein [Alphaproteobacteria bacterium]
MKSKTKKSGEVKKAFIAMRSSSPEATVQREADDAKRLELVAKLVDKNAKPTKPAVSQEINLFDSATWDAISTKKEESKKPKSKRAAPKKKDISKDIDAFLASMRANSFAVPNAMEVNEEDAHLFEQAFRDSKSYGIFEQIDKVKSKERRMLAIFLTDLAERLCRDEFSAAVIKNAPKLVQGDLDKGQLGKISGALYDMNEKFDQNNPAKSNWGGKSGILSNLRQSAVNIFGQNIEGEISSILYTAKSAVFWNAYEQGGYSAGLVALDEFVRMVKAELKHIRAVERKGQKYQTRGVQSVQIDAFKQHASYLGYKTR